MIGLLSVVRGYNILVIIIAQYLASIYILSDDVCVVSVLLNKQLFYLVFSTSLLIASGYIINDFYDTEKDKINKPQKVIITEFVSKKFKLTMYLVLNTISVLVSIFVSWRASLFMLLFAFAIWLYSHKLKRIAIIGNISASALAITPFFAVFLYYKNISEAIVLHAIFLYLLILVRELLKDLVNYEGDLIYGYQTLPVRFSLIVAKYIVSFLIVISSLVGYVLSQLPEVGAMFGYFYFSIVVLVVSGVLVHFFRTKKWYLFQYNVIKVLILFGVFFIALVSY
ncbi:MAG: geranylgeranylglycerol-phosphate geranylgeranyltransferase [Ichthyobacteriaceae bacterium]|nr:geranylgeranylglycerol-phosphate geranylgeranyltransferase [Ichthyobacteriaceae bacterium]